RDQAAAPASHVDERPEGAGKPEHDHIADEDPRAEDDPWIGRNPAQRVLELLEQRIHRPRRPPPGLPAGPMIRVRTANHRSAGDAFGGTWPRHGARIAG